MKKLIALFLILGLVAGAVCAFAENTEAAEEPAGWILPETIEMTPEVTEVFSKAMVGLVGVVYEPLGFLGELDGTYCILCRAAEVYPGAKPYYTLVYVTESGLQNIYDIWMDKHAEKPED